MNRGCVIFLMFLIALPLAYPLSIKELVSRYVFATSTPQMDITGFEDYMADNDGDGMRDTLVIELASSNKKGNFTFVANLIEENAVFTNETRLFLDEGANKIKISFSTSFLAQNEFTYSIRAYNSTHHLKFRKDNIATQHYDSYERGLTVLDASDMRDNNRLRINLTINSSLNGAYETALFLKYNGSTIFSWQNITFSESLMHIIFDFDNETVKRTHYSGKFNISSLKIQKSAIRLNFTSKDYSFEDFAATPYISGFGDEGVDADNDGKYDALRIIVEARAYESKDYTLRLGLYDLFDNLVEIKNSSYRLDEGAGSIYLDFDGPRIHEKKLNGPFIVRYAQVSEGDVIADSINDAYTTENYDFDDFEGPDMPDISPGIIVSQDYHYGIDNLTVNFTFSNIGKRHAFNVFTEFFSNDSFYKINKTPVLGAGSGIMYQSNITGAEDLELSAFADPDDIIEESNESNNVERITIKINHKPALEKIIDITVDETDNVSINLSASDIDNDDLSFSINSSRFRNNSNIFEWKTNTLDSGNYTFEATASDGYLSDSMAFNVIVNDALEKDFDNDGIEDDADKLIGSEKDVSATSVNLSIFLDDSRNLSRMLNQSMRVRFFDNNLIIAEFDFNFSLYRLNLTNLTIAKQSTNSTGYFIFSGLLVPDGMTKTLYVDKVNQGVDGLCIRDEEIISISQISDSCNSENEFRIECDGTMQNDFICTYNSTIGKYKVEGLKHSGAMQLDYTKPVPASTESSASSSPSASGNGGGGGISCDPDWQCGEWGECDNGLRARRCSDANRCAFAANRPKESEQCIERAAKSGRVVNAIVPISLDEKISINGGIKHASSQFSSITGKAVDKASGIKHPFVAFVILGAILLAVGYLIIRKFKSEM